MPPDPVIIGPGRNVEAGTRVELVCISPDNREIKWFDPSGMFLNESTEFFDVTAGVMFNSTLIINNVQVVQHSGVYICRVGDTVSNITLTISFSVSEGEGLNYNSSIFRDRVQSLQLEGNNFGIIIAHLPIFCSKLHS